MFASGAPLNHCEQDWQKSGEFILVLLQIHISNIKEMQNIYFANINRLIRFRILNADIFFFYVV